MPSTKIVWYNTDMRKTIRVAVSTVLVAVSCYPGHSLAENNDTNSEPPSIPIDLTVDSPTFVSPVVGKSLNQEEQEKNKPSTAPQTAKKIQKRVNTPIRTQTPVTSHSVQSGEYVKVIGSSNEQCVITARELTGNKKIRGYAGNLKPDGYDPRVGAASLEKSVGHVSVVVAIDGDYIILIDSNWIKGKLTERKVHKSTQRGYIY